MIILIDSGNSRLKVGWLDASNPDMPREPAAVAFDGLDLAALDRWLDGLPRRAARPGRERGRRRAARPLPRSCSRGCAVTWAARSPARWD